MARPEKAYATASQSRKIISLAMMSGETRSISIDWNQILGELGTTISTSCWESDGALLGLASPTVSGGVASVSASASCVGAQVIKNTTTMVNGEVFERCWYIKITDPLVSWPLVGDYQQ